MTITRFGKMPDGSEIAEVVIAAGDLTVSIVNFGAVIRDVRLAGVDHPLVLGFDNLDDYVAHSPHFGAVAGRSANRIDKGRFTLDGREIQLSLNEQGLTHLHGGFNGFGKRAWRLVDHDDSSVTLAIASTDGEEGYPGHVEVKLRYTVEAPGLIRMEAEAITDAPTLVNLAQHSYFNLDGSPDILDHRLRILAEEYTPNNEDKVPTGEIAGVADTDYDFRQMRPIRMMRDGKRVEYDLNYVAARARSPAPRPMVRLESPKSRVALDVASTEPGVQFYDGCMMNIAVPGLGGRSYPLNGGCCFEPQVFPDAPNHPNFPSSVLRPGETYRQTSEFAFS
ncbi:MAG: aldose epimerase family protein, partial [Bauldia sp.]